MQANALSLASQVITGQEKAFNQIASRDRLVHWAEESRFALEALNKNPRLQQCSPQSIQAAIINVAACGLTLNPANKLAYLVPEYDKQLGQQVCHLRISFIGLCKVAVDSGAIEWVRADVVRAKDQFEYRGPCTEPIHTMNPFAPDRGEVVGVYCIAKVPSGDILCDVMSRQDIDKIRAAAKTQHVWNQWFEEMAKKAIIKRASKQWPSASSAQRFQNTVQQINNSEGNVIEYGQDTQAEYYCDERFQQLLPRWQANIESGKWDVDRVIARIESVATPSPAQLEQLNAITRQDT